MKKKYDGKCYLCGHVGSIENHHIIPKSMGGQTTVEICQLCHMKLTAPVRAELTRRGIARSRVRSEIMGSIAKTIANLADESGGGYEDLFFSLTGEEGLYALTDAVLGCLTDEHKIQAPAQDAADLIERRIKNAEP